MTKTQTPTLVRVEDHEGLGSCGHCQREGLRWIAVLSDGSQVGVECAKKVMGWKPTPKSYTWVAGFRPVAEFRETETVIHTLWENATGKSTRSSTNGTLTMASHARATWADRGWL